MSNSFNTRGTITYVKLRETSLYMTIREEGRHGASLVIKAFCPHDLKETPQVWSNYFIHHKIGVQVTVEGSLAFDRETHQATPGGDHEPVKHPITGRDIYTPYIWAASIDVRFDPAIHMLRPRPSGDAGASPQSSAAPAGAPHASMAGTVRAAPPRLAEGDLPPLGDDAPMTGTLPTGRASVAWNDA